MECKYTLTKGVTPWLSQWKEKNISKIIHIEKNSRTFEKNPRSFSIIFSALKIIKTNLRKSKPMATFTVKCVTETNIPWLLTKFYVALHRMIQKFSKDMFPVKHLHKISYKINVSSYLIHLPLSGNRSDCRKLSFRTIYFTKTLNGNSQQKSLKIILKFSSAEMAHLGDNEISNNVRLERTRKPNIVFQSMRIICFCTAGIIFFTTISIQTYQLMNSVSTRNTSCYLLFFLMELEILNITFKI